METIKPSTKMTSRERVLAALQGASVDQVPVMHWLNPHTACNMISDYQPSSDWKANLQARFLWHRFTAGGGMAAPDLWRGLPIAMTVFANSRYTLDLGSDIAFQTATSLFKAQKVYWENGRMKILDPFGSTRVIGGIYNVVVEPAIQNADDLSRYQFLDLSDPREFKAMRKFRKQNPDACIVAEVYGVQDLFSTQIWEMSRFMMALYKHPDEIKAFQVRFADWTIDTIRRSVEAGADAIFLYDDYGYTGRTLISMEMWRSFTLPHLERIIDAAHLANVPIILHSCGYQMPFLDDYVAIGLDGLQAFQPKAGNDFAAAYEKYGDKLTFITGIDTQLGELMTPAELRQSILDNYRIGRRKDHFILGMTHMLQYTMPPENLRIIFETVAEIQAGVYD